MKRRVVSLVTALVLCLNLCPAWALAADTATHEQTDANYQSALDSEMDLETGSETDTEASSEIENPIDEPFSEVTSDYGDQAVDRLEEVPALYDVRAASGQSHKTFTADLDVKVPYSVESLIEIDLCGFSITASGCTAMQIKDTGALTLKGPGRVMSFGGAGIEILSGGSLCIDEQSADLTITGVTYGLDVASGAAVSLAGGTFTGATAAAIRTEGGDFGALLKPGYAYFDKDGSPIPLEEVASAQTVVIQACTNHAARTYTHEPGATTHSWTCTACGTEGTESCTFAFDDNGKGICDFCKNEITIKVDRDSLKALAYDETIKPETGTVKVTLDNGAILDPSAYDVSYSTRANLDEVSYTVTATVTGIDYTGIFVQSYTFTKNELEQPVLQWTNKDDVSVTYTGKPVDESVLPEVRINITPNDGLARYLQYSHRKQGETAYTDGLPTNAGTYDVIATLPGNLANTENGQAASSEPITLIVKPLDELDGLVTTAPAAAKPVYNKQSQALVTPGVLNPAAVMDGAKIMFAASKDGDYSETIPTGVNAGNYEVWYKVEATPNCNAVGPKQVDGVEILPKPITPTIVLSGTSYVYDGSKKEPEITVKDEKIVIDEGQYTVDWEGDDNQTDAQMLTVAGTYTATITSITNGNYTFTAKAQVKIVPAQQDAISITNQPDHVYYGDKITTLRTTGGSGNGKVTWSFVSGNNKSSIDEDSGELVIKDTGSITVRAERTVPNYEAVSDTWTFTVEPKPVTAVVTIKPKKYDGANTIAADAITAEVEASDLVDAGDAFTISGLAGTYDDVNAGANKSVTLDDSGMTGTWDTKKYAVSVPKTATADIEPREVDVTVILSGNDLHKDDNGAYWYTYDGTEKTPTVTVTVDSQELPASEYTFAYNNNKNVSGENDATVTVKCTGAGNYTFDDEVVHFTIKRAGAQLTKSPEAKDLTYTGQPQELVTVGTAEGGHIEYSLDDTNYGEAIPKEKDADTYIVYYKVVVDSNHENGPSGSVSVTIKPKEITPEITMDPGPFVYNGNEHKPNVTVKDGAITLDAVNNGVGEYTVSYRDNINAGTATVIVSNANGGNYIVNGTKTFTIDKAESTFTTPPAGKTGLQYNGAAQELVTAGGSSDGTVVYSLNGGNYLTAIPTGTAVGEYTVSCKIQGDANHNDKTLADLTVRIDKNTVTNPTITLSSDTFKYNGSQQKPTITVYDDNSRLIPEYEYTVAITGTKSNNLVDVDTYTIEIAAAANSNYVIPAGTTRTFEIVPADQETISITGTQARVYYGDVIQLGTTGGTGSGTVTWKVEGADGKTVSSGITPTGLLTVKDVGGPITVTVTRTMSNYGDVSAAWEFSAGKKPVTAVLTGVDRSYAAGDKSAAVEAEIAAGDLVFGDTFTIPDLTGTFDDENAGTDKKITITGPAPTISDPKAANYDITYPATTTASITKADIENSSITAPTGKTGLEYTGTPLSLLDTAGSVAGGVGILEYSLDDNTYSASIPVGTDAKSYNVWYRVKGDSNHNDTEAVKLTEDAQIIIAPQEVVNPTIEFTPSGASYDGAVHKPAVTVKDNNNRVIPADEYEVIYGTTDWKQAGEHTVTITDKEGGNYKVGEKSEPFTILPMGQSPLSIVNQPGRVQYGDSFTLSAMGGSGTGTVKWDSENKDVATIDQNGLVKVLKPGSAKITATKLADGNYDEVSVTWSFSAEKKPVTPIVTAKDKVYDEKRDADLVITWKTGDLLNNDAITLNLTGTFEDPNVGTNKTVNITGAPVDDETSRKYDITIPPTTTASITKKPADEVTLNPVTVPYNGSEQSLVTAGEAAGKTVAFSWDGFTFSLAPPTGKDAKTYTIWYKVLGDDNHADSAVKSLVSTITRKQVDHPVIELSPDSFEYDGTPKKPDVTVKDSSDVIPSSEYTVRYSNNTAVGDATVTVTDNGKGNYEFEEQEVTFTIKAGAASYTVEPQAKALTYTGFAQELVTRGEAKNGTVVYALAKDGSYDSEVPTETDAGTYQVWYKIQGENGANGTQPRSVTVQIEPKTVIPRITLNLASDPLPYTGTPQRPGVTVSVNAVPIDSNNYEVKYSNNTGPGTATVTVQSLSGNYQFYASTTFDIVKAKAEFDVSPEGNMNLVYTGEPQELIEEFTGTSTQGIVLYSLDTRTYSAEIPTGTSVKKYTVYAKIEGDSIHADSDVIKVTAEIKTNKIDSNDLHVSLSEYSIPYTGKPLEPTVTVTDADGNTIDPKEYTVTYNDNVDVGTDTASVTVKSKGSNYSFEKIVYFSIIGADQIPLTITGKQDTVYYGDILNLGTTGGSSGGAVTWNVEEGSLRNIGGSKFEVTGAGPVTIKATMAGVNGYEDATDTWTFTAKQKPITATVSAADKPYDTTNEAKLTVTINPRDLVGSDTLNLTAKGHFVDANVGTNKTVIIDSVTSTDPASANYDIIYPSTVTASITKAAASVDTDHAPKAKEDLTYNGQPQALVTAGSATGGDIAYSLNGTDFSLLVPTATDAGTYTVWYKVLGDGNYTDSPRYKVDSDVVIAKNTGPVTVKCSPEEFRYDKTEKTPKVIVLDNAGREISSTEYTVEFPASAIEKGEYKVTVKDKPGYGNYEFTAAAEGTFTITSGGQAPLSIVTDIPTNIHYGDSFKLSAIGGSGNGAIQWSSTNTDVADIDDNGNVTIKKIGKFEIKAYRAGDGNYSDSNIDILPFHVDPKPISPVVTAENKSYDGTTTAKLTAAWKNGDLVGEDKIELTGGTGTFETADVGTNKTVKVMSGAPTGAYGNYLITWPESTTASIYKVDAKLENAPTPTNPTFTGSVQPLVNPGSTVNNIGEIKYSLSQNGVYSTNIPEGTAVGKYEVWFKVEETINYTGIAASMIPVEISEASTQPTPSPAPSAAPARAPGQASTSAPMQTSVQDGTATTVVSESAGSELVKEAAANNSQNVVIKPEISDSVTRSEVSIPAATVSRIGSETDADLTVSTPLADVTIPNAALSTLSGAGGAVDVVTERVEQAVVLTVTADGETVDSIPGGVTLTVPVEDAGPGTVAVLVHDDGARETIQKAVPEDGVISIPLDGSATVEIVDNSKSFDDVSDTSWAADAVAFASAHELFSGTSDTTFSPDEPMSRAMLATVLYNLEGRPAQDLTGEFSDVNSDAWYAAGISWAAENGITNGYGDGQFGPDDPVTREQFAVMLWKYMGCPAVDEQDLGFTDADQISGYALDALRWATANGILSGYGDGQLDPGGLATRAQVAQMMKNFLENI